MARKKILLFVVEGVTDSSALGGVLSTYFKDIYSTKFHEVHGDLLTKFYKMKTPKQSLGDAVKDFLSMQNIVSKDLIYKVVYIIDTDGCYVPDNCIKENPKYTKDVGCYYTDTTIETDDPGNKITRNAEKRQSLNTIISEQTKKILRTIPYEIYYFSCNRDHALHNDHNPTRAQKNKYAYEFNKKYEHDFEGFKKIMEELYPKMDVYDFKASWEYIKEGTHSLERGSNFYLFLEKCN